MTKLIETIVEAISDKKGKGITVLDLSGFDGSITDAFVICDASSTAQVEAIANGIEEKVLRETGEKVWRIEGRTNGIWVVMDYIDVMVHIFLTESREFYKLEELWADAPARRYESD